jgi:hypothetical protein
MASTSLFIALRRWLSAQEKRALAPRRLSNGLMRPRRVITRAANGLRAGRTPGGSQCIPQGNGVHPMTAEVSWPEEKRCSKCKRIKHAADFYRASSKKDGLSSACKKCHYGDRRDEFADRQRLRNFGLTAEEYTGMLAAQGGRCYICHRKPGRRRLAIDHDHSCCPGPKSCGKCIRKLLCDDCNRTLLRSILQEATKGKEYALDVLGVLRSYIEGNYLT